MQSKEIQEYSVKLYRLMADLFFLSNCQINSFVEKLDEYKMITYLSFSEFRQYMSKMSDYAPFYKKIVKDFIKYKETHKLTNFHFPIINNQANKQFQINAVKVFTQLYVKQQFACKQGEIKDKPAQLNDDTDYQFCDAAEILMEALKTNTFERSIQVPKYEIHKNELQIQQIEQFEDIVYEGQKYQIPQFFYYKENGRQRCSTKQLLSIDTTSIFSQQLHQVKQVILSQINHNDQFVYRQFSQFYRQYNQYNNILQNQEFDTEENFRLIQYYSQIYFGGNNKKVFVYEQKQSYLLKLWNKVVENAKLNLLQQQKVREKIKYTFSETLQNICLYYKLSAQITPISTSCNNKALMINVNRRSTSIYQFKNKLLKPYIFLSIYRQMANHLLLKIGNLSTLKDKSIGLANDNTVGCKILKIIDKLGVNIKEFFKHNHMTISARQNKTINYLLKKISQFLDKYKENFEKIRQQNGKVGPMLNKLIALNQLCFQLGGLWDFIKELWEQATKYIDNALINMQVQAQHAQHQNKMESEYKFVFAFIASKYFTTYFDNRYIPITFHSHQSYKNKILSLKRYYYGENAKITSFICFLKNKHNNFFNSPQVQMFSKMFLSQHPFKNLNEEINQCVSLFDFQKLKHCIVDASGFSAFFKREPPINIIFDQSEINEQNIQKALVLISIKYAYNIAMKFIKEHEIYIAACKIPSFFQNQQQPGIQIQSLLFPYLHKRNKIYPEDYQKMKQLSKNYYQIGRKPQNFQKNRLYLYVGKKLDDFKGLDLRKNVCGVSGMSRCRPHQVEQSD